MKRSLANVSGLRKPCLLLVSSFPHHLLFLFSIDTCIVGDDTTCEKEKNEAQLAMQEQRNRAAVDMERARVEAEVR